MAKRFGPAGIFSTDDPVSDQRQIEAEQGPWEEEDEEDYPEEEILYACCPKCMWWDHILYWKGDQQDLESAKEMLCEQHQSEKHDCVGELEFD